MSELPGSIWPFDTGQSNFFILNLAVGGDWPGPAQRRHLLSVRNARRLREGVHELKVAPVQHPVGLAAVRFSFGDTMARLTDVRCVCASHSPHPGLRTARLIRGCASHRPTARLSLFFRMLRIRMRWTRRATTCAMRSTFTASGSWTNPAWPEGRRPAASRAGHDAGDRRDTGQHDETYTIPVGKTSSVRDHYNSRTRRLRLTTPGRKLSIEIRAYDDGIAFRYPSSPKPPCIEVRIEHELTAVLSTPKMQRSIRSMLDGFQTPYEDEYQNAPGERPAS